MPGISMGQDIGCLHMPFMKPYYPISQSWYKSHKSRVNVSKVTSLSFICSLRNHWAHPVLHQNLGIRGWPWQHFSMWWTGVSWPFALYQCVLTSHSETWGGGLSLTISKVKLWSCERQGTFQKPRNSLQADFIRAREWWTKGTQRILPLTAHDQHKAKQVLSH